MSTTHITPTPGRIVWYRGADGKIRAAIIAAVNGDFNLNLYVIPLDGMDTDSAMKENVTHADPEQEPGCVPSWHWMPYQIEQAKSADARQLAAATDREADQQRWRAHALDMALRTPGVNQYSVLKLAATLQAYIEGGPAASAPQMVGASAFPPHQQRVIDERIDLVKKADALANFIATKHSEDSIFSKLHEDEQTRLYRQLDTMRTYSVILSERIEAFRPAAAA